MWDCPKCATKVDDDFECCWLCGTTVEGIEDPNFLTADESGPIADDELIEANGLFDANGDFSGVPYTALIECYEAKNPIEAKFIADRLMEEGIPAIADKHDINMMLGGIRPEAWGCGPKVRIRPDDLPRAQVWLKGYIEHRKARRE